MAQQSPPSDDTPPAKRTWRVTNWPDYNRALASRGGVTLWLHEEVLRGWRAVGGKGNRTARSRNSGEYGFEVFFFDVCSITGNSPRVLPSGKPGAVHTCAQPLARHCKQQVPALLSQSFQAVRADSGPSREDCLPDHAGRRPGHRRCRASTDLDQWPRRGTLPRG